MKKTIVLLSFVSTVFFANAQDKAQQCLDDATNIAKLVETKSYNEAATSWFNIEKRCNNLNENFYRNGEIIFEYQKEMSNTIETKKAVVSDIISIFDKYDAKFPENNNGNGVKKALYLFDYNLGTNDEIFNTLDISFKKNKNNFKNPQALYLYFDSYLNQFKSSKKSLTTDDLYKKHIEICQKIEVDLKLLEGENAILITKQQTEPLNAIEQKSLKDRTNTIQSLKTVESSIKSLFDPYITCDNLKKYCTTSFDNNQNDIFWLEYTSEYLFAKNCYNDSITDKITTKRYELNPNSKASFYLGYIMLLRNNSEKATLLFNESADKEEIKSEKAKIYYTMATVVYGINNKKKSAECLKKTLDFDPTFAKAYLFLAQLYENSTECFLTEFDKKAIYWLVIKTVKKAGMADKMFEKSSEILSEKYLKKAPTNSEIHAAGLKKVKNYTFGCWINETIEIPKI